MTKRKSYNPFKMWGSYIGLVIGGYYAFVTFRNLISCGYGGGCVEEPSGLVQIINLFPLFGIILVLALGFLSGWGIHSFFRRLSK